ncbi:cytochrome b562 [Marinomonas sp. TW1]|uniref:cytochrome b562 n=1 Tax=Marinomonas sp. TW1 TaxID=1561203 RepID=UPI000AA95F3D|nr:cytochrome b562 [Marinomonas sp. TW1]
MKKSLLAGAILLSTFSSVSMAHGSCGDTDLHGYMQDIKSEMRQMSTAVKSGNNDAATEHVERLIVSFQKSRKTQPHQFEMDGLEGEVLAQQKEQYVELIDSTIKTLEDLNVALVANDKKTIRQLVGEIGKHRKAGHSTFKGSC